MGSILFHVEPGGGKFKRELVYFSRMLIIQQMGKTPALEMHI